MADQEEANRLRLLSSVLIVLCILLLYCYWNKNNEGRRYDRFTPLQQDVHYGGMKYTDGMTSKQLDSLPGMKLSARDGMNDKENNLVNRHHPTTAQMRSNLTGLRWESEVFTPGGSITENKSHYTTYEDSVLDDMGAAIRAQQITGADVLTPLKPGTRIKVNSHGGDILKLTDYRPMYGPARGSVTV